MSVEYEMWEVVESQEESDISRLVDRYRMARELEQIRDELEDVSAYAEERVDLRDLDTYAIDPVEAQDQDDAFSIQREMDGEGRINGYTAWVHIADVSHYIEEGSTIDRYAKQQGFTVYGPDDANHMLPEEIAESVSFSEREDNLANTVELSFDGEGSLQFYDIYPSIVNTDRTMTYDVANYTMWQSENRPWTSAPTMQVKEDLQDAAFLSTRLADAGDRAFGRDASRRIIEEFMIKANEIGANELLAAGRGLYRNHLNDDFSKHGNGREAYYSPRCREHDGLGMDRYAHLTAPIRRYVDIVNWRIIKEETDRTEYELHDLATHLNSQQSRFKGSELVED